MFAHACHFTGKLSAGMKARLMQRATQHDQLATNTFRRAILRTCNAAMHGDVSLLTQETVVALVASQQAIVTDRKRSQLKASPH